MSLKLKVKGPGLSSDKRLKEEAKSEGHNSDEEEFEGKIMRAIKDEEDATSDLCSLPSETDEESVVAIIKSKDVHTNQLTLIQDCSKKQLWNTQNYAKIEIDSDDDDTS